VVWREVVWCGWRGVVWRGVVWRSAVWCGVVWRCVVWHGGVWCGVVWRGVVWCGVVWRCLVWRGVVWRGVMWRSVMWRGVVWRGVVWSPPSPLNTISSHVLEVVDPSLSVSFPHFSQGFVLVSTSPEVIPVYLGFFCFLIFIPLILKVFPQFLQFTGH